jgi:predicted flap endonuclease-1-like 5' DNA nuclease
MPSYKISEIEGIGPVHAQKLQAAGIATVNALLKTACTKAGRKGLAETTGIEETVLLKWANMADLFRIKGIGSEYSELLEKAGVDTVKELKNRKPENLHAKMVEVNSTGKALVRQLPGLEMVKGWIEEAKSLEPMVTY